MSGLERSLIRIVDELRSLSRPFALVGGLAVSIRCEPRFTRDADLAVAVTGDADAERLVHSLCACGYEILASVEQEATGRLATVRLVPAGDRDGLVTDLLFASSGIEPEIAAAADELLALPDFIVPVASVGHLIAMKLLARDDRRRPADADDLRSLAAVAQPGDWLVAEDAVAMIVARGFHRGRDLVGGLAGLRLDDAY